VYLHDLILAIRPVTAVESLAPPATPP